MGRGRKSFISQGKSKIKKQFGPPKKEDRELIHFGVKPPTNQIIFDIPEEVLNELRQLNPRAVANILVNS